ncbi:hypothetical protein [Pseudomonas sp. KNUC1026]|uniref:hypothetical protein n=1 Tax=Pseudomonas sp. KNUC1026 TaxID=2893890 RepID=UPI001F2DC88B|nr:hypothetical protein [Pseudomonas sp. KNUC1026]UFH48902.1 hypothetical protein LN139_18315 [Pseudomonas sp. KNUC1026]
MTPSLHEDVLASIRQATLAANAAEDLEAAPLQWLGAYMAHIRTLGWQATEQHSQTYSFTPAAELLPTLMKGTLPAPQAPNTRFRKLTRHLIDAGFNDHQPLRPRASDRNAAAHVLHDFVERADGSIALSLYHLSGQPDPNAPKLRLPLTNVTWLAVLTVEDFPTLHQRLAAGAQTAPSVLEGF